MILEAILLTLGFAGGVITLYAYPLPILPYVSTDALKQECDMRNIPRYQDPVESLQSLKDDPDIVYVWKVKDEAHRNQMIEIIENHEHKHGEFEAIHAVTVEGEKELWRLEKQELEGYL